MTATAVRLKRLSGSGFSVAVNFDGSRWTRSKYAGPATTGTREIEGILLPFYAVHYGGQMVRLATLRVCAAACGVLAIASLARAEPRRVLLLYSYEREVTGYAFAGLFRPELSRTSPDPIDFIEVALQTARTSQQPPDGAAADRLRTAFAGRALDLVIPIGGPAAAFAQAHRDDLF